MCFENFHYLSLFTSDARKFRVSIFRGGVLYWRGFVTADLYSESFTAPPYEVAIKAVDGFNLLSGYIFKDLMNIGTKGRKTLWELLPVVNIEIPAPKLTANLGNLRRVVDEYSVQMQEIFTSVRDGIYGWADDTNAMMQANFADMFKIVENYTAALTEKGWKFSEALEHVQSTMVSTMQTSRYETRTYQRYLVGMTDWEISLENIAAQFGDLSNLYVHGLNMDGYSAYLKNIYLQGFISDLVGDSWFNSTTGEAQLYDRTTRCGLSFKDGILRIGPFVLS